MKPAGVFSVSVLHLLLLGVLFSDVSAVPAPAVTTSSGRVTEKEQQKPTTIQLPVTAVTTSSGRMTEKEQQKPTTVQLPVTSMVTGGQTPVKDQQKSTTVQRLVTSRVPVQKNMVAVLGKMITLPCRAPANISIIAATWTRPDLQTKYVLLFQGGKTVLDNQQSSFKNRVALKDSKMKNGELSLVLKDVKSSDVGTYECRYKERKGSNVTTSQSISTINLTVPLSDDFTDDSKRHRTVMTITLSVIGVIAIFAAFVAVVLAIYKKCKRCSEQD